MTEANAGKFALAVWDLYQCGFLQDVTQYEPGVFIARDTVGWNEVARQLAERLPGGVIPAKGAGGIVWINGGGKNNPPPHGVIMNADKAEKILVSHMVAKSLGALDGVNRPVYSQGSLARMILKWVIPKGVRYEPECEKFLDGVKFGYHCCFPGKYVSHETQYKMTAPRHLFDEFADTPYVNPNYEPALTLYDVDAYYYTMISRLQSLRVAPMYGKAWFGSMSPDEEARFKDAMQAIGETKILRNSLAGGMLGGTKPGLAYTASKPKRPTYYSKMTPEKQAECDKAIAAWVPGTVRRYKIPPIEGVARAAGLLVVRSGYELCREEAMQAGAKYAIIDSVVCTAGNAPRVWERHGFSVSKKASGDGELCHRGSYRVGRRITVPYGRESREYTPIDYGNQPPVLYYKSWL